MPDPAWPCSPPEANYLRLAGPGAAGTATTIASAAVWQALMALNEVTFSLSTFNAGVTALGFEGVGGLSSATAVTGLNTQLQLLAGWVQQKPPIAFSGVAAYQAALAAMIPAEVSLANRAEQAADVAMNPMVLGALTPAIVALDIIYFGEHWPQNASAGTAYGAALAALVPALAVPPPLSAAPPAAPAAALAAAAQTAAEATAGMAVQESGRAAAVTADAATAPTAAAGQAMQIASTMAQPMQSVMGSLQPALGMFQAPLQALQGLASMPLSAGRVADEDLLPADGIGPAAPADGIGPAVPGGGIGLGVPGVGAAGFGSAAAGSASAAVIGGGAPAGFGAPGAGLTSYTRPTNSFAPENSARSASAKPGLPGGLGVSPAGLGGVPMPVSPTHGGVAGLSKAEDDRDGVVRARLMLPGDRRPEEHDR